MANDKQFKLQTKYVATRGVKEYRETIAKWVTPTDTVLEIGCAWGSTTTLLAAQCHEVIGTDISPEVIARARERHPQLHFEVLDAYDVRSALAFGKQFTKIYIDVSGFSGYRSLLDLIALLNMYATILQPQAIIVKSGALKQFAGQCIAWRTHESLDLLPPHALYSSCDRPRDTLRSETAVVAGLIRITRPGSPAKHAGGVWHRILKPPVSIRREMGPLLNQHWIVYGN